MYGSNISTSLSLTKILTGISKTLSIANQAIPIYKEIKPLVGNAKKVVSILKDFNKQEIKNNKKTIDVKAKEKIEISKSQSVPLFFQ